MNEDLLRFNFNQKYIVFDWETNGLNLCKTLPWQLGFVTCKGKNITGKFERKIWWPDYEMSDEVAMLNHFYRPQYEKEARDPLEVLEEFDSYLYDPEYIIVGQNVLGFDVYVHNTYRLAMGKPSDYSYLDRVIDTKAISMAIAKGSKRPPKDDILAWQYTFLNHRERGIKTSQGHMLKHYNIPHQPELLHNSIYDVEMTFEILKRQLFEVEI
jgi:DNA polymerase III epsilon subunit-like protein